MFSHGFEREGSRTPPLFAYHSYPAPEEIVYPPYPQSQPYRPVSSSEYSDYLAPVPVTLPSMMHFHEAIKREDDTMSPYNMSYQGLPAIDIQGHHSYEDSNPHVSRSAIPPAQRTSTNKKSTDSSSVPFLRAFDNLFRVGLSIPIHSSLDASLSSPPITDMRCSG